MPPLEFDMTDLTVDPLSCNSKDSEWSMNLPPVTNAGDRAIAIDLKADNPEASLFLLSAENVLGIDSTALDDISQGKHCPDSEELSLDFTLSNEGVVLETQSITIPIQKANKTSDDEQDSSVTD